VSAAADAEALVGHTESCRVELGMTVRTLGGWSFAHSVRIDRDDNIRAIDKGSDMSEQS
jgi:hypothetical protein